jgi:hypothetical protein
MAWFHLILDFSLGGFPNGPYRCLNSQSPYELHIVSMPKAKFAAAGGFLYQVGLCVLRVVK